MTITDAVARGLSKYLVETGTSNVELADYLGVNRSVVTLWKKGERTPHIGTVDKMCEYFRVTPMQFLGMEQNSQINRLLAYRTALQELMTTAVDASDDDIQTVTAMLKILKDKH